VNKAPTIKVSVRRLNPKVARKAHYETYEVPLVPGMSVLNVLQYINEHYDGGLAHYYSCRRGVCVDCALKVNGKVKRACLEWAQGDVTLEPVSDSRVIKDLVVRPRKEE